MSIKSTLYSISINPGNWNCGPNGWRVEAHASRGIFGVLVSRPLAAMPRELMDATSSEVLTHPWGAELAIEATAKLERVIAEAIQEAAS